MFKAVQNGYPIMIRNGAMFCLLKEEARDLNEREEKMYRKSHRHFGYMFRYAIFRVDYLSDYDWLVPEEHLDGLDQVLNSDAIYDMIENEKSLN